MVSKIESHDQQLSALSGLKKKMTPKIIDASSCISSPLAATNPTPRHVKQQSAKQLLFNSVKWQSTNGVVVNHSPVINGFIIRPASDNQPLKRHSPKSYSVHDKNDHHQQQLQYHNSSFNHQQQQQQAQQVSRQQSTQRYSPSRVSPTAANGIKRGSSAPPVSNASAGAYYAGAKFSEPPAPDALPKPPTHWMNFSEAKLIAGTIESANNYPFGLGSKCCAEISDRIKILLNMQA